MSSTEAVAREVMKAAGQIVQDFDASAQVVSNDVRNIGTIGRSGEAYAVKEGEWPLISKRYRDPERSQEGHSTTPPSDAGGHGGGGDGSGDSSSSGFDDEENSRPHGVTGNGDMVEFEYDDLQRQVHYSLDPHPAPSRLSLVDTPKFRDDQEAYAWNEWREAVRLETGSRLALVQYNGIGKLPTILDYEPLETWGVQQQPDFYMTTYSLETPVGDPKTSGIGAFYHRIVIWEGEESASLTEDIRVSPRVEGNTLSNPNGINIREHEHPLWIFGEHGGRPLFFADSDTAKYDAHLFVAKEIARQTSADITAYGFNGPVYRVIDPESRIAYFGVDARNKRAALRGVTVNGSTGEVQVHNLAA